jgi:hypothetical protein
VEKIPENGSNKKDRNGGGTNQLKKILKYIFAVPQSIDD